MYYICKLFSLYLTCIFYITQFEYTCNYYTGLFFTPSLSYCMSLWISITASFYVYDPGMLVSLYFTESGARLLAANVSLSVNTIRHMVSYIVRLRIPYGCRRHGSYMVIVDNPRTYSPRSCHGAYKVGSNANLHPSMSIYLDHNDLCGLLSSCHL